jgi:hypothetical protein
MELVVVSSMKLSGLARETTEDSAVAAVKLASVAKTSEVVAMATASEATESASEVATAL